MTVENISDPTTLSVDDMERQLRERISEGEELIENLAAERESINAQIKAKRAEVAKARSMLPRKQRTS